jgi:hypothetical protein
MATKILIKKSVTSGSAPVSGDIDAAELAVNLVDRKIYTKDNAGAIITLDGAYVDSTAPGNPAEGDLWYDTANNLLKAHNGSAFVSAGYQTLAALEDTTITAATSGDFLRHNGTAWVDSAIQNGDISSGMVTQHQGSLSVTESQISDLQSYLTSETSHADVLVDGDFTSAGFMKTDGSGTYSVDTATYLTAEANDLSSAVTWANVPNANITQGSVTQHQAALAITESQISDLQSYLTAETNDLSSVVTWANVPNANITQGSVTQHEAALTITESQISDLQAYITDVTGDNLSALADVTITSIATGELLKWNGTAWVNNTLTEAGVAAASHTHGAANITSGTFANARISSGSVTQHEGDLTVTASQVSDFASTVAANAAVALNTAKVTNVSTNLGYTTAASAGTVTSSDGTNATLPAATTSLAGLMTAADKVALNAAITAEADTLATVTGRGATTATAISLTDTTTATSTSTGALTVGGGVGIAENLHVGGNTIITGNLTVDGTTTSVNSNTVEIGDSIITLNSDEAGTPSQNGGFEVERGTSANVSFVWNEADDAWDLANEELQNVTLDGGTY